MIKYPWSQLHSDLGKIIRDMTNERYRPEYIIGVARGGHVPAIMLSHYFAVPFKSIIVQLRDGIVDKLNNGINPGLMDKDLLIFDDINDSGDTFKYIRDNIFYRSNNIKYAALVENVASPFETDYFAMEINKKEDPHWIVFPWEEWWV